MAFLRSLAGGLLGGFLGSNRHLLIFGGGVVVGMWAEQTYALPDLATSATSALERAKQLEREHRK